MNRKWILYSIIGILVLMLVSFIPIGSSASSYATTNRSVPTVTGTPKGVTVTVPLDQSDRSMSAQALVCFMMK
jgi:hypothetical protein